MSNHSWKCDNCGVIRPDSNETKECEACFNLNTHINTNWFTLIIDGFIRIKNKNWKLNLCKDINNIILMFYGSPRYFARYNPNEFKVSDNNKIIKPIGGQSSPPWNYMIYPSPNGFKNGIHQWSVKYISNSRTDFFRSIGVTPFMNQKWISDGVGYSVWSTEDKQGSYLNGWKGDKWPKGSTILVVLNVDLCLVEYFCDDIKVKEEKLTRSAAPFYFALCIDSWKVCGVFESY